MSAISVSWLNVSWGAVYIETNYGLMQHSYIEIKNKLLRALDSEYNVVDMATVFEVVAVLEKTPITPKILESTRLGKVINECRRRTKNEVLAKRAKHLLRYWRNMMLTHSSPVCDPKVESVPKTHVANKRLRKNTSSSTSPSEICWESPLPSPEPSTPKSITEEDVDRYLNSQWEGVNGCVTHGVLKDDDNGFREWQEPISRTTHDNLLIHILPYCVVD